MPSALARARSRLQAACADSFITSPSWAGEGDMALARHADRFDEHDVAAHRRPRESGRHADLGARPRPRSAPSVALRTSRGSSTTPSPSSTSLDHFERGLRSTPWISRSSWRDTASRVTRNQRSSAPSAMWACSAPLFFPNTRLFHLARHEVALGDLQLLGRRVADERRSSIRSEQRIGDRTVLFAVAINITPRGRNGTSR